MSKGLDARISVRKGWSKYIRLVRENEQNMRRGVARPLACYHCAGAANVGRRAGKIGGNRKTANLMGATGPISVVEWKRFDYRLGACRTFRRAWRGQFSQLG
jgi:hypothetical protein